MRCSASGPRLNAMIRLSRCTRLRSRTCKIGTKSFWADLVGERGYIYQAEALVISLGTANPRKKRRIAVVGQERDEDVAD